MQQRINKIYTYLPLFSLLYLEHEHAVMHSLIFTTDSLQMALESTYGRCNGVVTVTALN